MFRLPCGKIRNTQESEAMAVLEPHQVRFVFKQSQHNAWDELQNELAPALRMQRLLQFGLSAPYFC
jgi:hypothetical protein